MSPTGIVAPIPPPEAPLAPMAISSKPSDRGTRYVGLRPTATPKLVLPSDQEPEISLAKCCSRPQSSKFNQ